MTSLIRDDAAKVLTDPKAYADEDRLHAALTHLRKNAPVSYVDVEGYYPFWAITKHADVMDIERDNELWINEPRPLLLIRAVHRLRGNGHAVDGSHLGSLRPGDIAVDPGYDQRNGNGQDDEPDDQAFRAFTDRCQHDGLILSL